MGGSLSVYYGEFAVSPVPLELSFNYCSHKCAYCFANLNLPGRKADIKKTMRLLADYQNRETLEATLLKQGYPVLVSNRVDPFAASNFKQAVPVIRVMAEMGIPVAIQTKGGLGIADVLEFLPPSVWYVSISMLDDAVRNRIEPGAPAIDERFRLIETLTNRGHKVTLGLNPIVPEWLPDPMPLLKRAQAAGVRGVWIEPLHLNKKQQANLSAREIINILKPVLDRAKRRKTATEDLTAYCRARECAQAIGLEIFSIGQMNASDYFKPYRELYPKTFPTNQDFVNWCHSQPETVRQEIYFDDYAEVMLPKLPEGVHPISSYIRATSYWITETHKIPNRMSFRQLLALTWAEHRTQQHIGHIGCFAALGKQDPDGWIEVVDDNDLPVFAFSPSGFSEYFKEVN